MTNNARFLILPGGPHNLGSRVNERNSRGGRAWFDLLPILDLSERQLFDVNRAPVGGIAAGHPKDWTIEQLREPAQSIANQIEKLMKPLAPAPALAHDPQ